MENPFELINQKLDKLANQLHEISTHMELSSTEPAKRVLTISDAAKLLGIAKQTIYGYTMLRNIPHYKMAKSCIFWKRSFCNGFKKAK
jgi:predicted DNA-binding transcriptional regulator AlpA